MHSVLIVEEDDLLLFEFLRPVGRKWIFLQNAKANMKCHTSTVSFPSFIDRDLTCRPKSV